VPAADRTEEPMHREEPLVPTRGEKRPEKVTPTTVAFAETTSVSSQSDRGSETRQDQDVEDRDEEFDNDLFYSKYSMSRNFCLAILYKLQY
jgi:hypothetical protein